MIVEAINVSSLVLQEIVLMQSAKQNLKPAGHEKKDHNTHKSMLLDNYNIYLGFLGTKSNSDKI